LTWRRLGGEMSGVGNSRGLKNLNSTTSVGRQRRRIAEIPRGIKWKEGGSHLNNETGERKTHKRKKKQKISFTRRLLSRTKRSLIKVPRLPVYCGGAADTAVQI